MTEFALSHQEWLAECYHWVKVKEKLEGRKVLNYGQLVLFTMEQILASDLAHSTARGTGFGPASSRISGRLQGPPLLVQVVAFTEVVRPYKPRIFKLRLSDGESIVDAIAIAPSPRQKFSFDNLQLGYKVS